MDDRIKKVYELMYSPIITPYNLLENVKLDNYYYVKYYKGEKGITCEMKCDTDQIAEIFFYCFDEFDKLVSIFIKDGRKKKLIYNRQVELSKAKKNFSDIYESAFDFKAI